MKRISLLLVSLSVVGCLWAAPRDEQQARAAAMQHFAHSSSMHRMPAASTDLTLGWTASLSNGMPAFYVFNRGEQDGWVMISAEDRTRTVLAYANEGSFRADNIPANAKAWLDRYVQQIDYAASPDIDCEQQAKAPLRTKAEGKTYTPVAPICKTQWGQRAPYNQLCPIDGGERSVTGCVATAAAQLMKVYNYPTKGTGSHSYEWTDSDGKTSTLSSNFGNTTYDWAHMIDNYRATSATAEQEAAVATLMYHCGVACEMGYTSNTSNAYTNKMLKAMVEHFGYDAGIRSLQLDFMDEEAFVDSIAADLVAGRPVYMDGRTLNNSGHAFLCDGIDQNGLVHINWGWNGEPDAYYRVSVLNPESQGVGGSPLGEAYTVKVCAFTHVQPNQNNKPVYTMTGNRIYFDTLRMSRYTAPKFYIDTMENRSIWDWEGNLGIVLYKDGQVYNTYKISNAWSLRSNYFFYHVNMYQYFTSLPNGQYEFVPSVTTDAQSDSFIPVLIKGIGECRCSMTVTTDSIFLSVPEARAQEDPLGGWDPTTYPYTRMDNYYHDGAVTDGYEWNIQVGTANFYSDQELETEALILFTVQSGSDHSVLGSFVQDGNDYNTCVRATIYVGSVNKYSFHKAKTGECTVVYNSADKTYVMDYKIAIYGKTFIGNVVIPESKVRALSVDKDDNYSSWRLDKTYYSGLTTSQAVARAQSLTENVNSLIPYAVEGDISKIVSTPADMLQYKNCWLYLSDGQQPIYAYNTRWINDTDYATGNEISVGGKAVIVGHLMNYQGTTPEINAGYFCSYEGAQAIDQIPEESGRKASKVLSNGQLLIIRNGETYTLQGIKAND